MIKKSINPFAIMYGIAVFIGFALANVFLRKRLVNQVQEQQKRIEYLETELDNLTEIDTTEAIQYVLQEMEVEEIMRIISKKRGFECACIDKAILKKLIDGETLENDDLPV